MPTFGTCVTFRSAPDGREDFWQPLINDLVGLKESGLTSVRWRISWSDVFPSQTKPDGRVLELLHNQAVAFVDAGLETWVTLCGNSMPNWFLNDGAFADEKTTERWWPRYVDTIADVIGNEVTGFMPFESPIGLVHDGWRVGTQAPFIADDGKFSDAFTNVIKSWLHACRLLNGSPIALSLDATHPGATAEVREVWSSAITRGRVSLPGHFERELDGLLRSATEISLDLHQPANDNMTLDINRWRDKAIEALQWAYETFSGTPLSITAIPFAASDDQHGELLNATAQMVGDLASDGLELQHVWLGESTRVAGLTSLPQFG